MTEKEKKFNKQFQDLHKKRIFREAVKKGILEFIIINK